jgi:hypothetical protein
MNKAKIIGLTVTVLAVVGGVAVFNYFRKPQRNRDGFFNAEGEMGGTVRANCGRRNSDGSVTYYADVTGAGCKRGFKSVRFFGDREGL